MESTATNLIEPTDVDLMLLEIELQGEAAFAEQEALGLAVLEIEIQLSDLLAEAGLADLDDHARSIVELVAQAAFCRGHLLGQTDTVAKIFGGDVSPLAL